MGDSLAVAAKDAYTAYDSSAFVFRANVFLNTKALESYAV